MSSLTQKVLAIDWMGDIIASGKLADHYNKADDVAKILKLQQTLAFVQSYHSLLHKEEIYHGLDHSLITFMNAIEGAISSYLSDEDVRNIGIAALFHDIGHSCGGKSDKYNIQTAVDLFEQQCHVLPELLSLSQSSKASIKHCIEATFYPWKPTAKISDSAKILRDADIMGAYITDNVTLKKLFIGLLNEISISRYPYTIEQFMMDQEKFRSNVVWNSRWGKIKAIQNNWPAQFRRLRQVLQVH